jgi:Ca-activated chloride channel family protein
VAAFGHLLKGGNYTGSYTFDDVMSLARDSRGDDPFGYRSEFLQLVNLAKTLSTHSPAPKLGLNN